MAVLKGAVALLGTFVAVSAVAEGPAPTEQEVKAAFLCRFAEFVEWPVAEAPAEPEGGAPPVVIGVLGHDPFGSALAEAALAQAPRRVLEVRRVASADDGARCHILFVSESERHAIAGILRVVSRSPVLTVSDMEGFVSRGGMIGFATEDRRVRFDVNLSAVEVARLRISSRLLRLARKVTGGPRDS